MKLMRFSIDTADESIFGALRYLTEVMSSLKEIFIARFIVFIE